ncbi:MAG: hypothetical protein ACTS73_02600 [Arsenophonus sp. NEOnobi-MAG3]
MSDKILEEFNVEYLSRFLEPIIDNEFILIKIIIKINFYTINIDIII